MQQPEAFNGTAQPFGTPPSPPKGFGHNRKRFVVELLVILLVFAGIILSLRACSGAAASIIVSQLPPSVDATLGQAGAESVRAGHSAEKTVTPEQVARVERVFNDLRKTLTKEEAAILGAPRVTVLPSDEVNAFALPGGEVFVLTGLLDRSKESDDQLRGVLAHELGHAVHRHGVRGLVRNAIYGIIFSFFWGDIDAISATVLAGASELDELSYSRSMEEEADEFGADLLARGGHDAEGLALFLESLEANPIPDWLSTHPDSKERAKELRSRLKKQ